MNSRDSILQKLRSVKHDKSVSLPDHVADRNIYKDYPNDRNLLELFKKRFKDLHGELYILPDAKEASSLVEQILSDLIGNKCITFTNSFLDRILMNLSNNAYIIDVLGNSKIDSVKLAEYDISITTTDYLVARTGSIVLNSLQHGGRRLSVLPPIHIVIARTNQIIESLDKIFTNEYSSENWSYTTIISGPSRTSDIEKQLVLGAHGPKRLIVILIENQ
jgi:L-lactate dehydrogenase complex protein LldG